MNVLSIYTNYFPSEGGIQRVIKNLNENLVNRGHNVTVLCLHNGKMECEKISGVNVIRIGGKRFFLEYSIAFKEYINKNTELLKKSDIIHIHGYHNLFSWQAIRLMKKLGFSNKVIYTPHSIGQGSNIKSNFLLRIFRIFSKSNFMIPQKVVCISNYEKQYILKIFPNISNKIILIPNGINFKIPDKPIIKKIDCNDIKLLFVGRIVPHKGLLYIIKMIPIFNQKFNGRISLTIIGRGNYQTQLERYVKSRQIQNISFIGQISDMGELEQYYKNSDIHILLSQSESYGLVVAEALANGLISIVSNNSALKEFGLEKGCFLIDYPPNLEIFANLINEICRTSQTIGPLNPKKIRNWETAAKEYEDEYEMIYKKTHNFYPTAE